MYIDAKTLIELAALLTALGVIGGAALWAVKFVDRQKKQDQELTAIRKEQTLICYGVMACLRGLKEQGCDGPVTAALDKLEKHLNQAAHEEDS
ncbi:branched-chain amino acid ABC transporter permease [uncultured Oscillibacter sp.]|jgi:hypothetical protein|uniref:branched-chain amino acid ABC transporter permease n=1 Tax=uncultured Oscillibacter sp. TaxID=876091 RepID=UPI002602DCC4|nr:branched-chain amino acid ABC transporter permease [uncultured Oscillibacter sp.]